MKGRFQSRAANNGTLIVGRSDPDTDVTIVGQMPSLLKELPPASMPSGCSPPYRFGLRPPTFCPPETCPTIIVIK